MKKKYVLCMILGCILGIAFLLFMSKSFRDESLFYMRHMLTRIRDMEWDLSAVVIITSGTRIQEVLVLLVFFYFNAEMWIGIWYGFCITVGMLGLISYLGITGLLLYLLFVGIRYLMLIYIFIQIANIKDGVYKIKKAAPRCIAAIFIQIVSETLISNYFVSFLLKMF